MRVKKIQISPETLFQLMKSIEAGESIPENARYICAEASNNGLPGKGIITMTIADNSFEEVKHHNDAESLDTFISPENIGILNEILKSFNKIKGEISIEDYKEIHGDGG